MEDIYPASGWDNAVAERFFATIKKKYTGTGAVVGERWYFLRECVHREL